MKRVAVIAVLALAGCADTAQGPTRPTSGLLITIDTTRADALSCYGGRAGVTPHLDALAAEGRLFESARTVVPLTLPSHASMLTGLYPLRHGIRDNSVFALDASAETLAELARAAGFRTAAFVSAAVLAPAFGLDQGFEVYDAPGSGGAGPGAGAEPGTYFNERSAADVSGAAIGWLGELGAEEPFFLWVHFFDPHHPYQAPEEFVARVRDPYLAEVAYMDHAIGELVAALGERIDSTTIVVVADHGEGRGDHNESTHGAFCFDSTMRVPLIVRAPALAAERVQAAVSVVDVFPTLVGAMGLAGAMGVARADGDDGTSLLGELDSERGVYLESYYGFLNHGWSPLAGWSSKDAKYLHSSRPVLFDLASDPGEERELEPSGPFVDDARRSIEALADKPPLGAAQLEGEMLVALRALGYAAVGSVEDTPHPLADSDRPAPRDEATHYFHYLRALKLASDGDHTSAVGLLEALLDDNPNAAAPLNALTTSLLALGRFDDAEAALRRRLELPPPDHTTSLNLGALLERRGAYGEAAEHYARSLELLPGQARVEERLAAVRAKAAATDSAE